jgi:hypothetical protein
MYNSKFEEFDIVQATAGPHKGHTGVVFYRPQPDGRVHYSISFDEGTTDSEVFEDEKDLIFVRRMSATEQASYDGCEDC